MSAEAGGSGSLRRLSINALTETHPDMDSAAISGRNTSRKQGLEHSGGDRQRHDVVAEILAHFAQRAAPDPQCGRHIAYRPRQGKFSPKTTRAGTGWTDSRVIVPQVAAAFC